MEAPVPLQDTAPLLPKDTPKGLPQAKAIPHPALVQDPEALLHLVHTHPGAVHPRPSRRCPVDSNLVTRCFGIPSHSPGFFDDLTPLLDVLPVTIRLLVAL